MNKAVAAIAVIVILVIGGLALANKDKNNKPEIGANTAPTSLPSRLITPQITKPATTKAKAAPLPIAITVLAPAH
jgi:hypothetical protein